MRKGALFLTFVLALLAGEVPVFAQTHPILGTLIPGVEVPHIVDGVCNCDNSLKNGLLSIPDVRGLKIETYYANRAYLIPDAIDPLMRIVRHARQDGYTIILQSVCRTYKEQRIKNGTGRTIARPGKSRHGFGVAVDATLGDAKYRDLIGLNTQTRKQCFLSENQLEYFKRLTGYFLEEGWQRLRVETWHFEYGTHDHRVSRCTGYASLCGRRGPDDCK